MRFPPLAPVEPPALQNKPTSIWAKDPMEVKRTMLIVFARVLILFITVLILLRVTGKKQVANLQPAELVTLVMVADVAAIPMTSPGTPLVNGIVGIFALLLMQFTLSYITMKSTRSRAIISGRPTNVIVNGKIVEESLQELRYNINDLLEQLRAAGYPAIQDVEWAVLETNGQLSVIPKSQKRPVTPEDLGISTQYEGLPVPLIVDGNPDKHNLERIGLDMNWLLAELKKHGVSRPKDVLYASIDTQGNFYCQPKSTIKESSA